METAYYVSDNKYEYVLLHPAARPTSPVSVISLQKERYRVIAASKVQGGDGTASSSQVRQPCARDLVAIREVQSGDSRAPSGQTPSPAPRQR